MENKLSDTTLSWLAALIDGEGTVMLVRHAPGAAAIRRKPSLAETQSYRPRVGIYNTDIRLMSALTEKVRAGHVYQHVRPVKANHKKLAYEWRLTSMECRYLLPLVRPWLILKGEQTDLLLEALVIKDRLTPKKGEPWTHRHSAEWGSTQERMEQIAQAISTLNRKGRET